MEKEIWFDMDGTIADLYGVENWLEYLTNEDVRPYVEAKPLVDMEALNLILDILKRYGWKVVVTTWLAKNASEIYNQEVRKAKINTDVQSRTCFDGFKLGEILPCEVTSLCGKSDDILQCQISLLEGS